MPGNDAELGFAVLLEHGHVDRAVLASGALGRGHHVLALQALDEVDTEGRSWLDANAPGWCVDVAVLPFGSRRDGSAREVQPFYNAWLVLAERTHREAWQARLLEEQIQRQAVAVRIARAQAENPDAVFCAHCGNIMTAYQRRQMSRQAQFGFSFLARGYECRECGCSQLPPDDKDAIEREAARIKARSQVGLPWRGRSQTDATKAEWRRREKSPPEAAVECLPGMSCADIIAELQRLSDRADSARHPNLHLLGGPD